MRKVVTPWARPGSGFTLLFEAYVLALAKTMPIKDWVEKKVRRHLMQARNRRGFGWTRWNRQWLYRRRSNRLPPKF